jgi:hypothetical protein
LQFAIHVSPMKPLTPDFRSASLPGHIVASRNFEVAIPSEGSEFPIDLVDPSTFEERGLPKETVWAIDWRSEDFDQPAEDVLMVLINKEQGEKLLRLSGGDSVGAVVWREIAVEIFVEVSMVVFRSDPPVPQNNDGLLAKIYARLQKDTGENLDQLVLRAKGPTAGMSYFRAHLQKGMEVAERIRQINLAGRHHDVSHHTA